MRGLGAYRRARGARELLYNQALMGGYTRLDGHHAANHDDDAMT
jgi:hypothetical protein